jgi:hypothetical protein
VTLERPQPRTGDFFGTLVLLAVLFVLAGLFVVLGFGMGLTTMQCAGSSACNETTITAGSWAIIFGIPGITLTATIISAVRIVKRRLAFWVPLVGIALVLGVYLAGSWLIVASIPAS